MDIYHMRPYLSFVFKEQPGRRYLIIAAIWLLLQWLLFKWLYPFGDYFTDSYSYLEAAVHQL
ncbi:MAG: hypothetical protein JST39_03380, partial [Bacteroidetes bacterium]|nr:hypothetical protein [Bacteroidota bacterium]